MKTIIYIIGLCLFIGSGAFADENPKVMTYRHFIKLLRDGEVTAVSFQEHGMMAEFTGTNWTNSFVIRERNRYYHLDPLLDDELKAANIEPTYSMEKTGMLPMQRRILMGFGLSAFLWLLLPVTTLVMVIINNRRVKRIIIRMDESDQKNS